MATILGVLSLLTMLYALVMSYRRAGDVPASYGAACFLAMLFAVVGLVVAVISRFEKEKFYFFSYLGMILNVLALCVVSLILYAGAFAI